MMLTRLAFKFILPITVACLALSLAARALGSTQPPNPALRGFTEGCEDKPQPCWYGIVPGVTNSALADSILSEFGFRRRSERSFDYDDLSSKCLLMLILQDGTDVVETIEMGFCGEKTFGDVMAVFGQPDSVLPYLVGSEHAIYYNRTKLEIRVRTNALSAFSNVVSVVLSTGFRNYVTEYAVSWTGLLGLNHYCKRQFSRGQLQSPGCGE